MARAPRLGPCNTRLEPLLGAEGGAALQAELIRHTAGGAQTGGRPVWVASGPPDAEAEPAALVPAPVVGFAQRGRDLGERLTHAVNHVAGGHTAPLSVLGTSPTLRARDVEALELTLAGGWDAGLIGAPDGGDAANALSPRPRRLRAFRPLLRRPVRAAGVSQMSGSSHRKIQGRHHVRSA